MNLLNVHRLENAMIHLLRIRATKTQNDATRLIAMQTELARWKAAWETTWRDEKQRLALRTRALLHSEQLLTMMDVE